MLNVERIINFIDQVNLWVGRVISFLLIPLTFITFFEVIMRYAFSKPTIWSWDLNITIFAALSMLGGGYTLMKNAHVGVDVVALRLGPKKRALLDMLTSLFFFFGIGILMVYGFEIAWDSVQAREKMSTIWAPPYYPFKICVPLGAFFLFLQGIAKFLRDFITFTSKTKG